MLNFTGTIRYRSRGTGRATKKKTNTQMSRLPTGKLYNI